MKLSQYIKQLKPQPKRKCGKVKISRGQKIGKFHHALALAILQQEDDRQWETEKIANLPHELIGFPL